MFRLVIFLRFAESEVDSRHAADFRDGIVRKVQLFVGAPDGIFVFAFRKAKGFAVRNVDVRSQVRSTDLLQCLFKLRVNFNKFGFADAFFWPAAFGAIVRIDEILHDVFRTE